MIQIELLFSNFQHQNHQIQFYTSGGTIHYDITPSLPHAFLISHTWRKLSRDENTQLKGVEAI